MKGKDMSLFDRIANYFKEWNGIDDTAPKMELSIHELRYIANMNVERFRLIRQLNEANFKTEKIRNKVIDEFASTLIPRLTDAIYQKDVESMTNLINDVARELKAGV